MCLTLSEKFITTTLEGVEFLSFDMSVSITLIAIMLPLEVCILEVYVREL